MVNRNFIDFNDISVEEFNELYMLASEMKKNPAAFSDICTGKIVVTLFYEPSTRTQLSFQSAMMRLGGKAIGFADPSLSSVAKGESLRDTIKIATSYADLLVIRSPAEGTAYASSLYSHIPVINAGDGSHLHPTQTLADLMTITELKGRTSNLTIGFCGDLLNGRTVHSLIRALARYEGNRFVLISTPELRIPEYVTSELTAGGCEFREVSTIEECIGSLDFLYMTRIQRERFKNNMEEYFRQAGIYRLTTEKMNLARSDMYVLHPLPKVDEISPEVDDDPRVMCFEQAENGLFIRMALISKMVNAERTGRSPVYPIPDVPFCGNDKCITNQEAYLPKLIKNVSGVDICCYCDHLIK